MSATILQFPVKASPTPEQLAPPKYMPAYCDPNNEFKGEKFERDLNVSDIAKRIRKEILAKKKAGEFPKGLKTSVRIQRYSGGQSLNITVKDFGFAPTNPEYVEFREQAGSDWHLTGIHGQAPERYNEKATKILGELKEMRTAYNRDNSDIMVDYFDVNFYGSVEVDWEYARELLGTYW